MSSEFEDHVLLQDEHGNVVHSTLHDKCFACVVNCPATEVVTNCGITGKRRRGRAATKTGLAFLCTRDPALVASRRIFKRELAVLLSALERLRDLKQEVGVAEAQKARRLVHNLTSLNAHALQEIYSVINQDRLSAHSGFRSQKEMVRTELLAYPDVAARLFLLSLKNAAAVKSELAVFRKLNEPAPKISLAQHSIHRVVLNVANYFFQDFYEQQIRLNIESTDIKVRLDYESMQVALYHLLDNASKYAKGGSTIRVAFSSTQTAFTVSFEMTSLYLAPEERSRVLQEGFSGSQAHRMGRAGEGIGMGIVNELMRLIGAALCVEWANEGISEPGEEYIYAKNRFSIAFPIGAITRPPRADIVPSRRLGARE
jgi:signal transduction histidine kinase